MSKHISYLKAKHWIGNSYKEPIYQDKGIGRQLWRRNRRSFERQQVRIMCQYSEMENYTIRDAREALNDYNYMDYKIILKCKCSLCSKFRVSKRWRVCK